MLSHFMLQFYFSGDLHFNLYLFAFLLLLQKFLIRHIHAECAKRGGDDDGHDCYGEDDLAAAKACCRGTEPMAAWTVAFGR